MTVQGLGARLGLHTLAAQRADILNAALDQHIAATYRPASRKELRLFSGQEAAEILGFGASALRKMHFDGRIPEVAHLSGTRRLYSAAEIDAVRAVRAQSPQRGEYVVTPRKPHEKLQVFSGVNFKGGSGKSTFVSHLAQRLALRGYRVLIVDMDPQASLTSIFGYRPEIEFKTGGTIYDALRYDDPVPLADVIQHTYFHKIDIAPGGLMLAEFEHETPRALRDGAHVPFYARLRDSISGVAADYDVVLIDCPPQLGFTTLAAVGAATGIFVTIVPNMLDMLSMGHFLSMLGALTQVIHEAGLDMDLDCFKFVLSRFEPSDNPQTQVAGLLRTLFREDVLTTPILKSTAIADAGIDQKTIYEVDRSTVNRDTYARIVESLNGCFDEIEAIMLDVWGRRHGA